MAEPNPQSGEKPGGVLGKDLNVLLRAAALTSLLLVVTLAAAGAARVVLGAEVRTARVG